MSVNNYFNLQIDRGALEPTLYLHQSYQKGRAQLESQKACLRLVYRLGHLVGKDGVQVCREKVSAIKRRLIQRKWLSFEALLGWLIIIFAHLTFRRNFRPSS